MSSDLYWNCSSIQVRNRATLAYTPGLSPPHPMPHDTIPLWKNRSFSPGMGHTNGLPPSPLQVSLPGSPPNHDKKKNDWIIHVHTHRSLKMAKKILPAQTKLECKLKWFPNRVVRNTTWHGCRGTIGKSIFFKITWYLPSLPQTSLPQPLAKHRLPSKL